MLKLATFRGTTVGGDPLVQLFRQGDSIIKVAGTLMPSIQDWLSTYKSDKKKVAVLVNALGASEFWGQNVNGDIFPEAALLHDCSKHEGQSHPRDSFTGKNIPPYGAWTFKQFAKPFVHHKNKDPNRAFGTVEHWVWNPRMHRVELVVLLDRAAALKHGAASVIDRIDAGEYPDVSMGCRVPYDVCTICGNKSKTRHDYCTCIKEIGMGTILKDGRRVGVINTYPRFFDISFVFIGADKTAKVMCKLGSSGLIVPLSAIEGEYLYGSDFGPDSSGLVKAASESPPPHLPGIEPPDDTNALAGKTDTQDHPNAVDDGILQTNQTDLYDDEDEEKDAVARVLKVKEAVSSAQLKAVADVARKHGKKRLVQGVAAGAGVAAPVGFIAGRASKKSETKEAAVPQYKMGPPPMPNRKEFPFVGSINFRGLEIGIENPAGGWRTGHNWKTLMKNPYGEFLHTKAGGVDGDKLDVFVGPVRNCKNVFVVHQNFVRGPKKGQYDEDKVMLGFDTPAQAKKAYLAHYDSDKYFRSMTTMAFPLFKRALIGGEVDGEKVASLFSALEGYRDDMKLEDLFDSPNAMRRQRTWKNKDNGEELCVEGSGMAAEILKGKEKEASVKEGGFWSDLTMSPKEKSERMHAKAEASVNKRYPKDPFGNKIGKHINSVPGREMYKAYRDAGGDKAGVKAVLNHPGVKKTEKQFGVKFKSFSPGNAEGNWKFDYEKTAQPLTPLEILKLSVDKNADHSKWADIVKEIGPDKATGKVTEILDADEPSIPKDTLDDMGCKCDLSQALSTPSMMGMVLKPAEFQRIMLGSMGKKDLADKLDESNAVFKPEDGEEAPCESLSLSHVVPELMKALMPLLGDKSYAGPVVRRRIIKIIIKKPEPSTPPTEVKTPLLSKVASAYNWYRMEQLKLAAELPEFIRTVPTLSEAVYDLHNSSLFHDKEAMNVGTAAAVGSVPLSLMYSAHLRGQQRMGKQHGFIKRQIAEHPWLTTLGTAGALRGVLGSRLGSQIGGDLKQGVSEVWKGKPV